MRNGSATRERGQPSRVADRRIRLLLLFEAATFAVAAAIHAGLIAEGNEHREAFIAETVIAAVLLVGAALTWTSPRLRYLSPIVSQAFAALGTLVGLFTIAIGVGPRTVGDVVYHVVILAILCAGIAFAARAAVPTAGET